VYFVDYERGTPWALVLVVLKLGILALGDICFITFVVQFQAMRHISYAE
jgi:hypothetical protein